MIARAIRLAAYAFALTIVLAGLADAAASGLGGSEKDAILGACLVAMGLAAGLVRPGPCGSLHLFSALALGLAAWVFPRLPVPAVAALLLGCVLPLSIVGRRFGEALAGVGPGGVALPVGLFFGLIAAGFGTGPWLYLLMVFGILWPPPAAAEPDPAAPPAPAADRVALFLVAFAAGALWLTMRPMVTVFDSENVLQDTRRAVAIGLAAALGWWTLGAALADGPRLRSVGGALLALGTAVGLLRTTLTSQRLASPEEFTPLIGSDRLLGLLGRADRLTEIDDLYVPWLTLVLAGFPTIALFATLRVAVGESGRDARWPARLGMVIFGAALGTLVASIAALPLLGDGLPGAAFLCLLVAAIALAAADRSRLGLPLGLAGAALVWAVSGLAQTPATGRPFYDLYEYALAKNAGGELAQRTTDAAYARVIARDTPALPGSYQLYDGANQLTPSADENAAWTVDALFPLLANSQAPERCLLVGVPHADTVRAWRELGAEEVHLAVDPPELAELAWGFTPEWSGLRLDGLSATASRAEGEFDLVVLREHGLWDPQRARAIRPAAIRQAAARVAPQGVLAIVLDPRRTVPGLTRELAETLGGALQDSLGDAAVYLIPHSFFAPSLVILARRVDLTVEPAPDHDAWQFRVREQLRQRGLPLHAKVDLPLLQVSLTRDESELFPKLLAGPLPPLALSLSATAPFRAEDARPDQRSARVLGRLGEDGSLTWVMAVHAAAQVWSLKDTQVVPREQKVDLSKEALDGLLALARQTPESELLRYLAESFGYAAVRKREVEWAFELLQPLVDEVGWRSPWLLVSYGETLLEMLEPEGAEALANEALGLRPDFEPALRLRAIARGEADPFLESRAQHEGHVHH